MTDIINYHSMFNVKNNQDNVIIRSNHSLIPANTHIAIDIIY